ncbi:MAG: hypothetical protein AAF676_05455 [Pseudomonadota bacterium]
MTAMKRLAVAAVAALTLQAGPAWATPILFDFPINEGKTLGAKLDEVDGLSGFLTVIPEIPSVAPATLIFSGPSFEVPLNTLSVIGTPGALAFSAGGVELLDGVENSRAFDPLTNSLELLFTRLGLPTGPYAPANDEFFVRIFGPGLTADPAQTAYDVEPVSAEIFAVNQPRAEIPLPAGAVLMITAAASLAAAARRCRAAS